MPTYSYLCQKCRKKFLIYASFGQYDKKDQSIFKCPNCGSRKISQVISGFSFVGKTKGFRCACGNRGK